MILPISAPRLLFLLVILGATAAADAASFQDLGVGAIPTVISADGSVAAGTLSAPGARNIHPFRWTSATGVVDLSGQADDIYQFTATGAISGDGLAVFGTVSHVPSNSADHTHLDAFRWTAANGLERFLSPNTYFSSEVTGASLDGSVTIGNISGFTGTENYSRAFRWTVADGVVNLGPLADLAETRATGLSADGAVIVGYGENSMIQLLDRTNSTDRLILITPGSPLVIFPPARPAFRQEAFRWTEGTGLVGLGFLPGAGTSQAVAVSRDGSVIIGTSDYRGFRWTATDGMVDLAPTSDPERRFSPRALSADGSVIVGQRNETAVRWDSEHGVQPLAALLKALGVDLGGLSLENAVAVSADGRIVAGTARDFTWQLHGWIAELGTSPPSTDSNPEGRPTIAFSGKPERATNRAFISITGTTQGSVTSVLYRVGKSRGGAAHGTTTWRIVTRLKPGRNVITIIARGPGGSSEPIQVIVTRF